MTDERYRELMDSDDIFLTADERREGWHYCLDWDLLLVGPDMPEKEVCMCKGVPNA